MSYRPQPPPGGRPSYGGDPFQDNGRPSYDYGQPAPHNAYPPDPQGYDNVPIPQYPPVTAPPPIQQDYLSPAGGRGPSPGPGDIYSPNTGYDPVQRYNSPGNLPGAPPPNQWGAVPNIHNAPSGGPITDVYMPDYRMTSPPPLMHHSSSQQSGLIVDGQAQNYFPGRQQSFSQGGARPYSPYGNGPGAGGNTPGVDLADEPLLQRQHSGDGSGLPPGGGPHGRYGNPFSGAENGMGGQNPDEPVTMRYGPAPDRVLRRLKTTKRVQLFRGNLVLECPVPSALLDLCPIAHRKEQEFSLMRYTAVTCQPDNFMSEQYTLRQKQLYEPTRKTEIFIVITMYNEDEVLFARTMRGVMANIAHLTERDRSPIWKDDGWKKVVVCIVVDGRKIFNPRTRAMLAALGVYQEGVAKNVVNGKPVTAHVYEYTTQLSINSRHQIVPGKKWAPVQIVLCVKENNAKKINSHRWFFNAFGPILQPNVCVLLDVGTDPAPTSIYHLWKTFDLKPNCGGACGEIVALKGKYWKNLLNPLVAAQNFEYKMSNILDKPLESAFGWITVLPGAFSAYRYKALENDAAGNGPLRQYFLGEEMHGSDAGIFDANMYLAEDRILCWELVSKRNSRWILHYVKSAAAITDVPDGVPELVAQRRRWLNGSFFAAIHSIAHFYYMYRSAHSFGRKFFLHIEMLYQAFNIVFAWFSLGNYFIAFFVLTQSLETYGAFFKYIRYGLLYLYLALLISCFILSMGNRPAGSKVAYTMAMVGFAVITGYMIFAAIWLAVKGIQQIQADGAFEIDELFANRIFKNIVLSLAVTYGLYIVTSILAFDPWHMLTSFVQYLFLAPSYINVLNVYAFSNVHDVSWGTKGSDKVSMDLGAAATGKGAKKDEVILAVPTDEKDLNELYADELRLLAETPPVVKATRSATQKQEDFYKTFRTNVLLFWVLSNGALTAGILTTSRAGSPTSNSYLALILYSVAGLAAFRFVGACWYLILRLFQRE